MATWVRESVAQLYLDPAARLGLVHGVARGSPARRGHTFLAEGLQAFT